MPTLTELILAKTVAGKIDLETGTELLQLTKKEQNTKQSPQIAVIGIALQMPGAENPAQFWSILRHGKDCIGELPANRRSDAEQLLAHLDWNPGVTEYAPGGYLAEIDKFDYAFFKMVPKEAGLMDPSQRLFLETAWQAIEDAGYGGGRLTGNRTGVYVGFNSWPVYGQLALKSDPEAAPLCMLGNLASVIPGRISYLLDLHGPAVMIDTACSSSLTAVHLACQGIRNGDCEQAIAGGVNLRLIPLKDMGALGIESSSNRTRTFDDRSDGTVWGEGVAAILLKPLSKAVADGDHVWAVIKGSSLNHDGSSIGMTAPNVLAQEDMIAKAWQEAGVDPETITYLEAHGTGTSLGDPIEIDGLTRGFRHFTNKKQFCAIGSVKSNMGHLDCVSGIAGLIKAMLALKYREIPPSLHFCQPNRKINFMESPVYVSDRLKDWPAGDQPRRAGVNSFGLSGTNCHVVLEEAPIRQVNPHDGRPGHLVAISAKSIDALAELIRQYQKMLAGNRPSLENLCFTANTGRGHYDYRLALLITDLNDLAVKLNTLDCSTLTSQHSPDIFYGKYKVIPETKTFHGEGELTTLEWRCLNEMVQDKIRQYLDSQCQNTDQLQEIAKLYVQGANIDWTKLYPVGNREVLPVYPFQRNRCWLEYPGESATTGPSDWYYHAVWRLSGQSGSEAPPIDGSLLLISEATGSGRELSEILAKRLRSPGRNVIQIKIGPGFHQQDSNDYQVSGDSHDYELLFEALKDQAVTKVVITAITAPEAEVSDIATLTHCQRMGAANLFNLAQALVNLKFTPDLDIALIATHVHQVTGTETRLHPEQATLFGLSKVIRMEHLNLHCRCIDIEEEFDPDQLAAELLQPARNCLVAFRGGQRYLEELTKMDLVAIPDRVVQFQETGVYIITGGTGGIGLEVSRYFARIGKLHLALLHRTPLPQRHNWDTILAEAKDPRLCRTLRTIVEIEATGTTVDTYPIDIAAELPMKKLLDDLRKRFGRINGIVHSAGVPGDGLGLAEILLPKVQGTWLLHRLTLEDTLDFLIMFSSGMTVTGGIGVGAYTAANAYLDAFAAYRRRTKPKERTLTINWPTWRDSIMKGANDRLSEDRQLFKFITNPEAISVFESLLHKDIHRAIVGRLNDRSTILYFADYLPFTLAPELKTSFDGRQADLQQTQAPHAGQIQSGKTVQLTGKESGAYLELERQLALVWSQVLGFNEINVYDSFYDLGGDSIKAVQVMAGLPQFKLEIVDILRYPTIAELSQRLSAIQPNMDPREKLNQPEIINDNPIPDSDFDYLTGFPAAKILEKIVPFNEVLYKDCFYNAFFPVIGYYDKEIGPFLGDDLVMYQYQSSCDDPKLDIGYRNHDGIEKLLEKTGITIAAKPYAVHLLPDLIQALASGHPVIIRVDCFYEPNRYDMFQENHWEHCLLIFGYDQTTQVFHCLEHDDLNSLSYKPLMIGYYHLQSAYRGYLKHFQQDRRQPSFYEFSPRPGGPSSAPEDLNPAGALRRHIGEHKEELLNQGDLLQLFQADWQRLISDPAGLSGRIDPLAYLINKIIKAKNTQYYQIGHLLPEQAAGLRQRLTEIITGWNYLKVTVEKYKYSGRYRDDEFKGAAGKLAEIARLETEYQQLLFTICEI